MCGASRRACDCPVSLNPAHLSKRRSTSLWEGKLISLGGGGGAHFSRKRSSPLWQEKLTLLPPWEKKPGLAEAEAHLSNQEMFYQHYWLYGRRSSPLLLLGVGEAEAHLSHQEMFHKQHWLYGRRSSPLPLPGVAEAEKLNSHIKRCSTTIMGWALWEKRLTSHERSDGRISTLLMQGVAEA